MIVYEDRNRIGRDAAKMTFSNLAATSPPADAIERASFLYGMQSFCRQQLQNELSSALDSLEDVDGTADESPLPADIKETLDRC